MAENSVDSIVTDGPYELTSIVKRFSKSPRSAATENQGNPFGRTGRGFMGQTWDGTGVVFDPATWAEAYRVLKPGGHLLAFGGSRTYHRIACAIEDAGFEIRDQIMWIYGSGFPKSHDAGNGWGTALKPAHEPIVVARKPLIGTVARNVETWGTGAINIDGCRVGEDGGGTQCNRRDPNGPSNGHSDRQGNAFGVTFHTLEKTGSVGRFPANVITDGSDEVLAAFPSAPGQLAAVSYDDTPRSSGRVYGDMKRSSAPTASARRNDGGGSAARFFYCAKASKADREEGLATPDEGRANGHPTVKPNDLMRYLCRLVTPPGGTVFDPFMGSGSTGKAAMMEGFSFIGCEITPEYVPIAQARIERAWFDYVASLG